MNNNLRATYCIMTVFCFLSLSAAGAENGGRRDCNTQTSSNVVVAPLVSGGNSPTNKPPAQVRQAQKKKIPAGQGEWPTCGGMPYDPAVLECWNGILVRLGEAPPKNTATKPKP